MPVIGLHLEGQHDERTVVVLLARLLGVPASGIDVRRYANRPRGWKPLVRTVRAALLRFWEQGATGVVLGIDNDGEPRTVGGAVRPDSGHPRHVPGHAPTPDSRCRYCRLGELAEHARGRLRAQRDRDPARWPLVIAVPVEALESWLLWGAQHAGRPREARPEDLPRSMLKQRLYGRPKPVGSDFEQTALPIAREMDLDGLRRDVPSFRLFAEAVEGSRDLFLMQPEAQS